MLQEQGKLRVEDEVTKVLPDYPTHGERITIDHLLTHTSGIPSYTGLPEWRPRWREDMKVEDVIALFKDKPLELKPSPPLSTPSVPPHQERREEDRRTWSASR